MTEQLVNNFVKQALAGGMPREKIAQLLDKAQEIANRGSNQKTAGDNLDNIVSNLISGSKLDKTASSVAYTHGILKEAIDNGASPKEAIEFTKVALDQTRQDLELMYKLAYLIGDNQDLINYAEGFVKAATDAGMSQKEASVALVNLIEREKSAADAGGMFKQPSAPTDNPDLGAAPGDPSGGGMGGPGGQQIPPELLQYLLAMISGGQGGPQQQPQPGAGAGAGPAAGLAQ